MAIAHREGDAMGEDLVGGRRRTQRPLGRGQPSRLKDVAAQRRDNLRTVAVDGHDLGRGPAERLGDADKLDESRVGRQSRRSVDVRSLLPGHLAVIGQIPPGRKGFRHDR